MGVIEGDGVGDFFEGDGIFVGIGGFDDECVDGARFGLFELFDTHALEAGGFDS